MPGASGSETRKLDGDAVLVRLPIDMSAAVRTAAAAKGMTAAAWLRDLAGQEVGVAPPAPAPPVPPSSRHAPTPLVLAVDRLREAVAETAGALVRAAVLTRTTGAADLHAEIEAVLPDVRNHVLDLINLKNALHEVLK